MNVLSLFSGVGGLDLGLERAGMKIVGQVEIDEFCRRVLTKHWPEVPRHDDVRTCIEWWRSVPRPQVDLVAGGFPCQPSSTAGRRRAGEGDERWLWPAMAAVVDAIRPAWVVAENVPGLRTRGLAAVLGDLDRLGYRARAGTISACAVGAPHVRERLFILAHPDGQHGRPPAGPAVAPPRSPAVGVRSAEPRRRNPAAQPGLGDRWADQPRVGRVAYGVPGGVDRRRALGNAVVPQVAERIGRLVMETAGVAG